MDVYAISYADAVEAYKLYRKFTRSPYNQNTMLRFEEFLGCPVFTKLFTGQISDSSLLRGNEIIPEASIKKIRWLNGPHGYTLFKAWKAQHENQ